MEIKTNQILLKVWKHPKNHVNICLLSFEQVEASNHDIIKYLQKALFN